jgi:hypothetical protein
VKEKLDPLEEILLGLLGVFGMDDDPSTGKKIRGQRGRS